MTPVKLTIFLVVTAGFLWLSRGSLRNRQTHGFYRFFAWEAILVLVLLNSNYWFDDPFCSRQIVSWIMLLASAILVVWGVGLLYKAGKPDNRRNDTSLIGIEKTTELVTTGLYGYIRHPLYSSLLFGTWGAFFKRFSIEAACLSVIATLFLIITARREEAENIRYFGIAYQGYMKRTKMFVPFLF